MENSFIIWLDGKDIISKKDQKTYHIFTGKLTLDGKIYDLSGFKTEEKEGKAAYIKGKVKPEYNPDEKSF